MKLLSIDETGEILGLSRWTVSAMLETGQLPGIVFESGRKKRPTKTGRKKRIWRISELALQKWIEAREQETKKVTIGSRRLQAI
jgi:hypothetical protein